MHTYTQVSDGAMQFAADLAAHFSKARGAKEVGGWAVVDPLTFVGVYVEVYVRARFSNWNVTPEGG